MKRGSAFWLVFLILVLSPFVIGQSGQRPALSAEEKAISEKMGTLRSLDDAPRAKLTYDLAHAIRKLPAGANKLSLASGLANLSTESDSGKETMQAVADSLVEALKESPARSPKESEPPYAFTQLAQFARYEGLKVEIDAPEFAAAMARLQALESSRGKADFALKDLEGKEWTLSRLKGKVVLVNFWATWCPPCRREMPDMEKIHGRFKDRGLVILAISDEEDAKVRPFIKERGYTFPVLLDPGRKVNEAFQIGGIPNSFIFDRSGKLVAQAIDGRSERQLLVLLAKAGLK